MLGIDPAKLGGRRRNTADPPLIWPDMVDGVGLFFAMQTQWRYAGAGMGGSFATGLIYEALEPTARGIGVELSPRVFSDVRTLESAALTVWSKRRG